MAEEHDRRNRYFTAVESRKRDQGKTRKEIHPGHTLRDIPLPSGLHLLIPHLAINLSVD